MEHRFERFLVASRWLQAPLYAGLVLLLACFTLKFGQELIQTCASLWNASEQELVLTSLALIDLILIANLLVMVMLSGYENFVSQIDYESSGEKLNWVGKLDSGTLKIKVATSIVLISAIHLLGDFVKVENIADDKLMWRVLIHLTFVSSALLMGVLDKLAFASHRQHASTHEGA